MPNTAEHSRAAPHAHRTHFRRQLATASGNCNCNCNRASQRERATDRGREKRACSKNCEYWISGTCTAAAWRSSSAASAKKVADCSQTVFHNTIALAYSNALREQEPAGGAGPAGRTCVASARGLHPPTPLAAPSTPRVGALVRTAPRRAPLVATAAVFAAHPTCACCLLPLATVVIQEKEVRRSTPVIAPLLVTQKKSAGACNFSIGCGAGGQGGVDRRSVADGATCLACALVPGGSFNSSSAISTASAPRPRSSQGSRSLRSHTQNSRGELPYPPPPPRVRAASRIRAWTHPLSCALPRRAIDREI